MTSWLVPVLAYHAIHPDNSSITIPPDEFKQQMKWLKLGGYNVISLRSLVEAIRNGDPIGDRCVVITFDDAFECIYTFAKPVLEEFGFTSTIFVVTDFCGGKNDWPGQQDGVPILPTLTWEQIVEMDRSIFDFGAHSSTHPRLDLIDTSELGREIEHSKLNLERHLGHEADLFAYPYGWYNDQVLSLVRRIFLAGVSTRLAYASSESDPYLIERIDINYFRRGALFRRISNPVMPFYLSIRRPLRALNAHLSGQTWR